MICGKYPKVTILSCTPLCGDRSNGMLMSSLFRGWPKDRLSQIYFRQLVKHRPHFDVCDDFSAIELCGRVRRSHELRIPPTESVDQIQESRQQLVRRAMQSPRLFRSLKLLQESWQAFSWLGDSLYRDLRRRRPDIVYGLLGNFGLTRLITAVCRRLEIPYFVHVTDDFSRGLYLSAPLSLLRHSVNSALRRAIQGASGCAAISPAMADEFAQRYKSEWSWFTTLVSAENYNPTPRMDDRKLHCVFTGNLGLGRYATLAKLSKGLRLLQQQTGIDATLTIYSTPDQLAVYGKYLDYPGTTILGGWATPEQLPRIYHDADVLVHVESFEPETVELVKFSFSTKLSQYMMSGRCVLTLGPQNVSSVSMPQQLGAGVSVYSDEPEAILAVLKGEVLAADYRRKCGEAGRAWASEWVEQNRGHARFRSLLAERAIPLKVCP